jgi:hypothetical protein
MTLASRTAATPSPIGNAAGRIAAAIAAGVAVLAARTHVRLQLSASAGELRALTDDRLRDIGVDRAAIEPTRPLIEVDAALMRRLMSMR